MKALRPLERQDLISLRPWRNNRKLRNLTHGFRFPVSEEMENSWFETNIVGAAPGKAIFAINNPDDGSLAGIAQLDDIDPIHRNARLGIFLGDTETRGKGLGRDALFDLLDFGFRDLNLHKIYLHVNASNKPAITLYEKSGFLTEGRLIEHYFCDGSWEDLLVMAKFVR